ncbi:MAG TPA: tetratricopeptide repeat protein, partial [Rhodothermales bacterium]
MNAIRVCALLVLGIAAAIPAAGQSTRVDQLVAEGDTAFAHGDMREAEARYRQAVVADRASYPARVALGRFAFENGDWAEAEDQFRAAIRLKPEELEARYYQAMVKREQGRHRPPLTGWLLDEFRDSRDLFEFILARDSTYRDVLFQYALLEQYRNDERAAMTRAAQQVRLKPDDPASIAGLFRMGRMYASLRGTKQTDWLEPLTPEYAKLFRAEALRREGALGESQQLLLEVLQGIGDVPRAAVHLLLARVFAAGHHNEAAEVQFWSAVDAIATPSDAALVFEEVKYVLNDEEIEDYESLRDAEDFRAFFRMVWARRDPMPAAASNARLVEHFRRLNLAEESYEYFRPRTFFNDPDIHSALAFGRIYTLNHNFNDKGLIFIRHGPPDARIFTSDEEGALNRALSQPMGPSGFDSGPRGLMEPLPTESWRYYQSGNSPELTFHFATKAGGNWRLIAAPMWLQALHDRREWGDVYAEAFQAMANGEALEIPRLNMRMQ